MPQRKEDEQDFLYQNYMFQAPRLIIQRAADPVMTPGMVAVTEAHDEDLRFEAMQRAVRDFARRAVAQMIERQQNDPLAGHRSNSPDADCYSTFADNMNQPTHVPHFIVAAHTKRGGDPRLN